MKLINCHPYINLDQPNFLKKKHFVFTKLAHSTLFSKAFEIIFGWKSAKYLHLTTFE